MSGDIAFKIIIFILFFFVKVGQRSAVGSLTNSGRKSSTSSKPNFLTKKLFASAKKSKAKNLEVESETEGESPAVDYFYSAEQEFKQKKSLKSIFKRKPKKEGSDKPLHNKADPILMKISSSEESVSSYPSFGSDPITWQLDNQQPSLSRSSSTSSFSSVDSLPSSPSSNFLDSDRFDIFQEKIDLPQLWDYNLNTLTSIIDGLHMVDHYLHSTNIKSLLKNSIFYKMKKFKAEQFCNVLHHHFSKDTDGWLKFVKSPLSIVKEFSANEPLLMLVHEHVLFTHHFWQDRLPYQPRKSLAKTILVLYSQLYVLLQEDSKNLKEQNQNPEKKIKEWDQGRRKKNLAEIQERVQLALYVYQLDNEHINMNEQQRLKVNYVDVDKQLEELMTENKILKEVINLDEVKKEVEFKPFIGQDFKELLEVVFQNKDNQVLYHKIFLGIIEKKNVQRSRFKEILQHIQGTEDGKNKRLYRIWLFIEDFLREQLQQSEEDWAMEKTAWQLHLQLVCLSQRGLDRAIQRLQLVPEGTVDKEARYEDYKNVLRKFRTRNAAVQLALSYTKSFEQKVMEVSRKKEIIRAQEQKNGKKGLLHNIAHCIGNCMAKKEVKIGAENL